MLDIDSLKIGVDIGSTTIKTVVLNAHGDVLFKRYVRHYSEIRKNTAAVLKEVMQKFDCEVCRMTMTGSGALAVSSDCGVPFVQEVLASHYYIRTKLPDADAAVELGGEDAKLTFFTGGTDQRMNETCAGGTGAFIDQMAAFLRTDTSGLDKLALQAKTVYPIASRCGVFAKTDILPLLNDGVAVEDIAVSIMQAVVNQTISGLAKGRSIKGKVVFLGGPLAFLQSLRRRFCESLKEMTEAVFPEDAEYVVAYGAGLYCQEQPEAEPVRLEKVIAYLENAGNAEKSRRLPPLFSDKRDIDEFFAGHGGSEAEFFPLEQAQGKAWLGIDSGSTTIKAVLVDADGRILYSYYGANKGEPLLSAVQILKEIYRRKQPALQVVSSCVTGYGSALLSSALHIAHDEVETVAHFAAARFFEPDVSFILDIGGQDIKCMKIRNGRIVSIQLNEACSAGCGSFIENFADSLKIPLSEFVDVALKAKAPVDLGTRCTVFMNSKVKQVQKEGADIGDIAAGLCYSVIRNACFKVMKITDMSELGDHVVAQGGAFANNALLRALELQLGKRVIRPSISGLMGAFGAALTAKERDAEAAEEQKLLSLEELERFSVRTKAVRCGRCANNCLLTVSLFSDGRRFVTGNRCERGADTQPQDLPNLSAYKYRRLFEYYEPLADQDAKRGTVGIPRVLNMYENYPLWFTLFTKLGFRVELSAPSSKHIFYKGYETIPSQTVCYPAKLAHGHILDLAERGIKKIFYPCLPREQKLFSSQNDSFNCPVVAGYPELLAKNVSGLQEYGTELITPFLPLEREILAKRLSAVPLFSGIPMLELAEAVEAAFAEMDAFRHDMQEKGREALAELEHKHKFGIVLAGHPYHVDPEVQHGIAELIVSCGMGVLTEDSVAHFAPDPRPLRVVDQWTYHGRLYRAGVFAAGTENLAVLQLVSFGCGLDAITADQLEEILSRKGRLYTQIKIDEGVNLGPAKIRIRSLLAAMRERVANRIADQLGAIKNPQYAVFTEQMRATHTLLIPQMSPVHFQFMETVFNAEGYKAVQLPEVDKEALELGLRYVNNDACYPAIVVIGQLLQAVQSGAYDAHKVAVVVAQTGGGCRATNYISLLRKALMDSGYAYVPIIAFSTDVSEDSPGFKMTGSLLKRVIIAGHYGDALMRIFYRIQPYELYAGSVRDLAKIWVEKAKEDIKIGKILRFERNMYKMIQEFDAIPLQDGKRRPRVGLVGEILLKYHPDANNHAARIIEQEGGEAVATDIMDFVLYGFYDHVFNFKYMSGSYKAYFSAIVGITLLELTRISMRLGFKFSRHFTGPVSFRKLRKKTKNIISLGHQTGEGWLLAAEMVKMLESGVNTILCMQPFGCLPNHITGKGIIKELKNRYPQANIIALDYDPGASETNQINRIKLMMAAVTGFKQG